MHDDSPFPLAAKPGVQPAGRRARRSQRAAFIGATLLLAVSAEVSAYTETLAPAAPLTVYLQVGDGSFTRSYKKGGKPGNNATINSVSTTLAAAAVGNRTAQAMTTNSLATRSFLDDFIFCTVPAQLFIGGFYRTTGGATVAAQVTATVPAALTNATGNTIPFANIQWTSSGIGDGGAEPFPAGTFVSGGVQTVGAMDSNTWNESCWTFSYLNTFVPAAGTFTGRVLYTLSAP